MTAVLPATLYRLKRGLCPHCGAPLRLASDTPVTRCGFCGGEAVLERRLRKVEPEVAGAPLRLYFSGEQAEASVSPGEAPWVRSKQFRQADVDRAACPGCGDPIEFQDDAFTVAAIHCRSCGTASKVERRLRAPEPDPSREVPRPRRADDRRRNNAEDADPETEHLIYRIVHETDLATRVVLARTLSENWCYATQTCARLLPALLEAVRGADPRLQ